MRDRYIPFLLRDSQDSEYRPPKLLRKQQNKKTPIIQCFKMILILFLFNVLVPFFLNGLNMYLKMFL